MTKFRTFLLFILLIQLFLPVQIVLADTGPKPTMDFQFQQEVATEPVTITSGTLYECEQSDCSDASPLKELGPQRFACNALGCSALAYGFSRYHKLEIQFSDGKTRQSNIFQTAGFASKYTVTVRPNDLLVEAHFSLGVFPPIVKILAVACLCALIGVGLIVGLIIFFVTRSKKK
ncbi:MAG TPA: hypothetical protein VK206_22670 [Anaerolineales bacterium]|nr:hypothetical protein [Anaerolineales bacterium]